MTSTFKPETDAHVRELVAWAAAEETPLDVAGRGSKRGFGRPVQAAHDLDLSALSGITLYEPDELVLSARAGTPIAEIEEALRREKQMFAFEPADLGPLLGGKAGEGSIGGMLACNLAGPRRIKAGAARDHFLGFSAVSGRGDAFKSGGRVVKNVTGYDLCKLMAGSFGTLAVFTDVTVKVLPAPEKTRTVLVYGLSDAAASGAMIQAFQSSHEASAAAHMPAAVAANSAVSYVGEAGGAVTAVRVEGPGPSVDYRCAALRRELGGLGATEELHSANSESFWRDVRDVQPFVAERDRVVWRLSVPPAEGPRIAAQIAAACDARYYFDWSGGLIWLALPATDGAWAGTVHGALDGCGSGHATLVRASDESRAAVAVFQPQDAALAALTRRVKESFDPNRVLNPGRMYPGV